MKRRDNGDGSFSVLPSGNIRYRRTVKLGDGLKTFSTTGKTKKDCRDKMNELIRSQSITYSGEYERWTLSQLCFNHLQYKMQMKKSMAPKSFDRIETTIKNQINTYPIGAYQINSIRPYEIEKHIKNLLASGLKSSSVMKVWLEINSGYKWAIKQEYISHNPCDKIADEVNDELKRVKNIEEYDSTITVLSETEERKLEEIALKKDGISYVYNGVGPMAVFTKEIGIRGGEACALKWKDYHRDTQTIFVHKKRVVIKNREDSGTNYITVEGRLKNLKERNLELFPSAIKILEEVYNSTTYKSDEDYIFVNSFGKPYNSSIFGKRLGGIYKECGFDKSEISGSHILRRTFATNRYFEGADVATIADYIGDTVETVLKCYINRKKKIMVDGRYIEVVPLPQKK